MSAVTLRCFEGMHIDRLECVFPCGRPKRPLHLTHDVDLDVSIAPGRHHILADVGGGGDADDAVDTTGATGPWDCLVIDKSMRLVSLAGPRFENLCLVKERDEVRGHSVASAFPPNFADILTAIAAVALRGRCGQVHLNFRGSRRTVYAMPVPNDHNASIGALLMMRPSAHDPAYVPVSIAEPSNALTDAPADAPANSLTDALTDALANRVDNPSNLTVPRRPIRRSHSTSDLLPAASAASAAPASCVTLV